MLQLPAPQGAGPERRACAERRRRRERRVDAARTRVHGAVALLPGPARCLPVSTSVPQPPVSAPREYLGTTTTGGRFKLRVRHKRPRTC